MRDPQSNAPEDTYVLTRPLPNTLRSWVAALSALQNSVCVCVYIRDSWTSRWICSCARGSGSVRGFASTCVLGSICLGQGRHLELGVIVYMCLSTCVTASVDVYFFV